MAYSRTRLLLAVIVAQISLLAAKHLRRLPEISHTRDIGNHPRATRIKAYFVNLETSTERKQCMVGQLSKLQSEASKYSANISFERFPAVSFDSCVDFETCKAERPACFPTGTTAYIKHGTTEDTSEEGEARAVRGVFGNWCSHLQLLEHLKSEVDLFDFFLVLEDDCIFKPKFMPSLMTFLQKYPNHWGLVALDTFSYLDPNTGESQPPPADDLIENIEDGGPLYSISPSFNTYWGAHAWLLHRHGVKRIIQAYTHLPAIPVDFFPKAHRPVFIGMWSYQTGSVEQAMLTKGNISIDSCTGSDVKESDINGKTVDASDSTSQGSLSRRTASLHDFDELNDASDLEDEGIGQRDVVVMGMPRNGATLLAQLLNQSGVGRNVTWTEAHPDNMPADDERFSGKKKVAVVVVRHPFAVLQRFHANIADKRLPEDDVQHGMQPLQEADDWVMPWRYGTYSMSDKNSWAAGALPDPSRAFCPENTTNACWSSLPEAWTSYIQGYNRIADRFNSIVWVRHEDAEHDPHTVVKRVAKAVGAHLNGENLVPENFGDSPLTDTTVNEFSIDFGSSLSCIDMQAICKKLDKPTLFSLGYHGCQMLWPGYDQMIYQNTDPVGQNKKLWEIPEHIQCNPRSGSLGNFGRYAGSLIGPEVTEVSSIALGGM